MFRRCIPRNALPQRSLRLSIPTSALVRIRGTTQFFSSSATISRQPELPGLEEPTHTQSDGAVRLPLSLQAIYFKPLHRTPQYGLPVCNLDIQSYSLRQLEAQCDFALRAAYYLYLPASGIVPRPKKIERWTVPRSNFVHKKSQENYERITHKRLIQIKDGHPETIELWLAFLKKNAIYGVGMKAHVWTFEELSAGRQTNISLENLHDTRRPVWAHFGPRKTVQTAAMVRELLESEKFRMSEAEMATQPSRPDDAAQNLPIMPSLEKTPKTFKKISPKSTDDELRFRELQVDVAQKHSKEYLDSAIKEQRTAEDNLVKIRKDSKSKPQSLSVPKSKPSQKVPEDHKEADSIDDPREEHRREADRLRDLELRKALEAKEAAEARAAEEKKKTAEFQTLLLAQFAAMQAELAALKAERTAVKVPEPAPASTTPVAPQEAPQEAKAAKASAEAASSPTTSPKEHIEATATGKAEPVTEPIPVNTSDESAEKLTAAPEAPVFDATAVQAVANEETATSEDSKTSAPPTVDSVIPEVISTESIPISNIIDPAQKPISTNTVHQSIAASETQVTESTVETSSPQPKLASKQDEPDSAENVSPSVALAEETQENPISVTAAQKLEPIPYESAELVTKLAEGVENQGGLDAAEDGIINTPIAAEISSVVSESRSEQGVKAEAQPKQHLEHLEQPESQIVNENLPVDEKPSSSELPESPDAMKRQPEVTRDEEPAPERHEKPEEVKDEEELR